MKTWQWVTILFLFGLGAAPFVSWVASPKTPSASQVELNTFQPIRIPGLLMDQSRLAMGTIAPGRGHQGVLVLQNVGGKAIAIEKVQGINL